MIADLQFSKLVCLPMSQLENFREVLTKFIRDAIDQQYQRWVNAPSGSTVYGFTETDYDDPIEADLTELQLLKNGVIDDLRERNYRQHKNRLPELIDVEGLTKGQQDEAVRMLLQAEIELMDTLIRLVGSGELIIPKSLQSSTEANVLPNTQVSTLGSPEKLSQRLPRYIEYMSNEVGWSGQTLSQNTMTLKQFISVCGDKAIQEYQRKDVLKFYDILYALPALWSKKPEWADKSLIQIAQETKGGDHKRLAPRTVKRHLTALSKLFDLLIKREEFHGANPASNFEFPSKGRPPAKRKAWDTESLRKLFSSPIWTGCHSASKRSVPGNLIIKDHRYWLPLLGVYHGNRLEEFAQLKREDVKSEDGIVFCHINSDGDRQLKNSQSIRRVPLHPFLKEIGFMEYVDKIANNPGDRIFPELKPGGSDGKLGHSYSKSFTRYRRDIGVYQSMMDYHSFRHGVVTQLYAKSVPEDRIQELIGHEGSNITRSIYKKEMPIAILFDAISTISWPEIEELALDTL